MKRRDVLRLLGAAGAGIMLDGTAKGAAAQGMQTRRIPSSGEPLPVIGMGTWQTFDVGNGASDRNPLNAVLRAFAAGGGTLIDSSPMYGRSEDVTGDLVAAAGLDRKMFIATKVWTTGRAAGIAQMEDSMRKLRSQRVDLMQVHNLVDAETHLTTLREWKRAGRVRFIGITHYSEGAHAAVAQMLEKEPVDFLQINYSVGERTAERRLLPLAKDKGVAVIANRPFAGGDLLRGFRAKPLPDFAKEVDCTSWAQLLLKFIVSHPSITCAIPATSNVDHIRDNLKAGYGRMPDEPLRARIAAAVA